MHGSSIQVVGVQVVDAFTAPSCLLFVVITGEVDLGIPFHDLSDASSKVLQLSHKIIDLIQMSNTLLNRSYCLIYQVNNIPDQRIIVCRNTSSHFSISIIEFIDT